GRLRARREMLMKLLIRGREDHPVLPVDAHKIPIALIPHERKSASADAHDMITGAVAMRLLVRAGRHLGHVRVHRTIGQQKYQAAAAGTTVGEIGKLDPLEIRDEVRFPGVVSLADEIQHPFSSEVLLFSEPIFEVEAIIEDESFVVEKIEHHRQVRCADEKRALETASIEMAIFCVERDRKKARGSPLKTPLLAARQLELRVSHSLNDVNHLFEQVSLCERRLSWTYFVQEHVAKVAGPVQVKCSCARTYTRPVNCFDFSAIDSQALDDPHSLSLEPLFVRVDPVTSSFEHVHRP